MATTQAPLTTTVAGANRSINNTGHRTEQRPKESSRAVRGGSGSHDQGEEYYAYGGVRGQYPRDVNRY